jgi:hypothetical protein
MRRILAWELGEHAGAAAGGGAVIGALAVCRAALRVGALPEQ